MSRLDNPVMSLCLLTAPQFGYAFLLHIYSSPMTHGAKLQGLPPRPDKHAVFTIILPLLQVCPQLSLPLPRHSIPILAHNHALFRNKTVLVKPPPRPFRICIHHRPHPFPLGSLVLRLHLSPS